jgi:hypothetical protein
MQKNSGLQLGFFNPRIFAAFLLCSMGAGLAMFSFASTPSSAPLTFGGPDPTVPNAPRYQIFSSGVNPGFGEFNIGFNPATGHIFAMNSGPIYRITTPERRTPALPECCAEIWENKSATITNAGLDPILWTDQKTGRTFASNSTAGANALYAYTDTAAPFNDGDVWVEVGAAPANGSIDHETIGSGPYPAALPWSLLSNPVNQGHYVLYCAQDGVGAFCQRSDDLGASYGPGISATGNGIGSEGCGGLHGHVHVAPDGTAWLPDKSCSGGQGGAISTNADTTPWTEFIVPNSAFSSDTSDPSIAFDENSTAYYCYVNFENGNENHAHVAVGKRNGSTIDWIRDVDIGASQGVVNAVFPEAVGGSVGRAACGFLGTNVPGSFQGTIFSGDWYLFVATTYDEGQNWVTVNATPNDPVQRHAGVCLQGINCGSGTAPRNFEDFNEITMDDKGRVLFGYDDGCVSSSCIAGTSGNDNAAAMRVARQIGGRTLLAQFDVEEPIVPKAPCLSGTRNTSGVHLTWKVPDNGGAEIVSYGIYRGNSSGTETLLLATGNNKVSFDDITADPAQPVYYYVRAINSVDAAGGALSNEVNFPATPGIQLLSVTSQKTHGLAGTFGVNLPIDGSAIECRTAGALPNGATGDYQLVFDFANPVASVTNATFAGTGSISSATIQNGNYVVNLSGVANAQRITVTLTGVSDSAGNSAASVSATMGVLVGDVNASKRADAGDVTQVRNKTVSIPDQSTFRFDVNNSGRIDAGDVTTTRNATVTVLP